MADKSNYIPVRDKNYVFKTGKFEGMKMSEVIKDFPEMVLWMVQRKYYRLSNSAELMLREYYKIKTGKDIVYESDI